MSRGIGRQDIRSPYSAAFTAASMMYREMTALIPLMLDEHAKALLSQEIEENRLLCINSLNSRKRVVVELQRRFNAVARPFWESYPSLSERAQRVALLYANRLYTVELMLNVQTDANLMELRIYDKTDESNLNPLVKKAVINKTLIEQDF